MFDLSFITNYFFLENSVSISWHLKLEYHFSKPFYLPHDGQKKSLSSCMFWSPWKWSRILIQSGLPLSLFLQVMVVVPFEYLVFCFPLWGVGVRISLHNCKFFYYFYCFRQLYLIGGSRNMNTRVGDPKPQLRLSTENLIEWNNRLSIDSHKNIRVSSTKGSKFLNYVLLVTVLRFPKWH